MTMPRRILMLLENDTYPHDSRVVREAHALRDAGYLVRVICPGLPGQPGLETLDGIEVKRYRGWFAQGDAASLAIEYAWSAANLAAATIRSAFGPGFDVVHVHNPPDFLALIAAPLRLFGKKIVYDNHDLSPELLEAKFGRAGLLSWVAKLLERASCMIADLVITDGEASRQVLCARNRIDQTSVAVVGNGPTDLALEAIRLAAPAQNPHFTVAYVGYLDEQDGVQNLLEAIAVLSQESGRQDLRCQIIGDGEALPHLRELAEALGVESQVEFRGRMPWSEAMTLLAGADLCVDSVPSNPYHENNTAVKVLEYMALGKPMVLANTRGHRMSADRAALYAPAENAKAFAAAIAELMDDPDKCAELGAIGRERFLDGFAGERTAVALLDAYGRLWHTPEFRPSNGVGVPR